MALKVRSRREKVGSGLGLLLGIIGFNLLVPFLFEKQAGFDGNQMLWAEEIWDTHLFDRNLGDRNLGHPPFSTFLTAA
ncbi:hypothetical protein [Aeromonas caviae]|uniref:hypothetical protein n=1 Tax=Aeromonas caviae TaxID=648 RepID=UPI00311E8451